MDRLRAMELFLSISQTRNFSETARRFGISATGVSRMITEIEEDLKVKLLLRSTRQVALTTYPLPRKGVGIYAFVETDSAEAPGNLLAAQDRLGEARADLVQPVAALPRSKAGVPRHDILNLIAMNQVTELNALLGNDAALHAAVEPILAGRLNFSDRRITRHEPKTAG